MDYRSKCKIRAKTVTLLEENTGVNLQDLGWGNNFLDLPKTKWQKEKK